ncbi:hypothetical protein [Pseudomonas amygdali]|uniref:hypothetical protein n=1 Tax=Pseudomonas amygdali TaxID=47877 RepID=UPI0011C3793D|nr:hypothetical protein [Pseudomonas amygdali]
MYKIFIAFFDELPVMVVAGLDWSAQSQLSEMRTRASSIAFKVHQSSCELTSAPVSHPTLLTAASGVASLMTYPCNFKV